MDGRLARFTLLFLLLPGCVNFPGIKPEGRHRSTAVDAALWRRPSNFLSNKHQDPVLDLARRITRVEDDLRRDGTITVKQPDVWGEGNLMEDLQEYDTQMKTRTEQFSETIQAFIANSDNAIFTAESNLSGALGPDAKVAPIENEVVDLSEINPLDLVSKSKEASKTASIALEPTEVARQHSIYIDVCQALRRRHLGDDNSRSAGYGLYKVRIPVSVLPGRETSEGFAAIVTLQAKPIVNSALLRTTFPKLAIADLVDSLTPNVRELLIKQSQDEVLAATDQAALAQIMIPSLVLSNENLAQTDATFQPQTKSYRDELKTNSLGNVESTSQNLENSIVMIPGLSSSQSAMGISRQAQSAELKDFIQKDDLSAIVDYVKRDMQLYNRIGTPKNEDIRPSLFKLFGQVQIVLEQQQIFTLCGDCIHEVGRKILLGQYLDVEHEKSYWTSEISRLIQFNPSQSQAAWLIAIQYGVLNQNLKRIAVRLGEEGKLENTDASLYANCFVQFYNLENGNEAQTVFLWKGIIEQEFPLYVFSLDPQFEEQTDVESLSRRRQMQLALAFSVAKQPFNSASRIAMSRQLALDEVAIGLNRTVVSFSHGRDTFGWYFRPRVQTPPVESTNVGALARTIWSTGPTESYDLRHRKLEPGTRECEVLMVMPSFVREVDFNVTSNWESLCKPGVTKRSYEEMMTQGRLVSELKACMPDLSTASCYRPGDVDRLIDRIDQLDTMLGMQTHTVKLPYRSEQSGNGLFGQGKSSLKPTLTGFYGLEFVKAGEKDLKMSFFLRGSNFHPTNSKVICGGTEADVVSVLSRELLQVQLSQLSAHLIRAENGFEVYVATADGVSNPQYIATGGAMAKVPQTGFSFSTPGLVTATFKDRCSDNPGFTFSNKMQPVVIRHEPTPVSINDLNRQIIVEISGNQTDGSSLIFPPNGNQRLQVGRFDLVYDAARGTWSISDASVFWATIAAKLNESLPDVAKQNFTLTLSARVGNQALGAVQVLNAITVQVTTCECPAHLPAAEALPAPNKEPSQLNHPIDPPLTFDTPNP